MTIVSQFSKFVLLCLNCAVWMFCWNLLGLLWFYILKRIVVCTEHISMDYNINFVMQRRH